jgi:hypothetical protein
MNVGSLAGIVTSNWNLSSGAAVNVSAFFAFFATGKATSAPFAATGVSEMDVSGFVARSSVDCFASLAMTDVLLDMSGSMTDISSGVSVSMTGTSSDGVSAVILSYAPPPRIFQTALGAVAA